MAEIVSPAGTRATVPDDMVPSLTARGWTPAGEEKPKRQRAKGKPEPAGEEKPTEEPLASE